MMTLLEKIFAQLRSAGLVNCAEDFSTNYLHKNKNWFAFQRYAGRDFSINAAIQCLRSLRSQQLSTQLSASQRTALNNAATQVLGYLHEQHSIAEVV